MGTPDNKRKSFGHVGGASGAADDGQQAKRAKIVQEDGVAKPKPAVDLSVLEKAKKALEKQKELKEKLARLKEAKASAAASQPAAPAPASAAIAGGPSSSKPATRLPPSLLLNEHGREVGAAHAPDTSAAPSCPKPALNPLLAPVEDNIQDNKHYDRFLGNKGAKSQQRRPRSTLHFIEEGKFQKQAEDVRLRAKYGDQFVRDLEERRQREAAEAEHYSGLDPNMIPLGTSRGGVTGGLSISEGIPPEELESPVPNVEWWDARILADKTTYGAAADGGEAALKVDRINHYIEHPVLLDPPAEAPPPPPQPLKLTKQELKKMRTQRRVAREQEKQELIRQGLLEPPKPKVKISNLMRVLGSEATADPTAIEAEVRRQTAERAAAHEDRNLARMLTPAERREKKLNRLLDKKTEEGGEPAKQVAIYKVGELATPQLKFKVEVNAKENHLTGMAVCLPGAFSVIVVEGGPKTLRRYEKLMLRRIDWSKAGKNGNEEEESEEDEFGDGDDNNRKKSRNYCYLVWTGVVKENGFKGRFRTEEVRSEIAARGIFSAKGVGHYWDLAAAYVSE
jgi:U4/U6 small nuclear ribonucleoprotein PRP3